MIKNYLYLCLLSFIIISCTDIRIDDVKTGIDDHTEYLRHEWELSGLIQFDPTAAPGKLSELDISAALSNEPTSNITFDGNSYSAQGVITSLTGETGSWSLDDPNFPTSILFQTTEGSKTISLGQSILSFSEELVLKETIEFCRDGSPVTQYEYILKKK